MGPIAKEMLRFAIKERLISFRTILRRLKLVGLESWPRAGTDIGEWLTRCEGYSSNGRINASEHTSP